LFLILLGFDTYSYFAGGTFEAASAVAETIGYLSIILAGAPDVSTWDGGRRAHRRSGDLVRVVARRPSKHLAGLHYAPLAKSKTQGH
jgi:transposase